MSKLLILVSTTAIAALVKAENVCKAYQGYVDTSGTDCVGECKPFEEGANVPYQGVGTPPNMSWPDTSSWCATVTGYSHNKDNKRKHWGFCECVFTPKTVYFADGGGVEELTSCASTGTIKYPGGSIKYDGGCLPFNTSLGYPFTDFDQFNATSADGSSWCPLKSTYYVEPPKNKKKNIRKEWGYCVETQTTREPTPAPPTLEPTTSAPSQVPTTGPTVFSATPITLANGGGVPRTHPDEESVLCEIPFTIEGVEGTFDSCVNMSFYKPYMQNKGNFPYPITVNGTSDDLWCPINKNKYNKGNTQNRFNWGYCLESVTTRQPTTGAPTTPEPTPLPTTPQPTVFQSEPVFLASGGGVPLSYDTPDVLCELPFRIKDKNGKLSEEYTSCLNFSDYKPHMAEKGDFPYPITPNTTTSDFWCPITRDIYNKFNDANKFNWGYCIESETTRAPTAPTTTPAPVSQPPTDTPAPVSQPPTDAPVPVSSPPTDAPVPASSPPSATPTDTPAPVTQTPTASSATTCVPNMVSLASLVIFALL